MQVYTFSTGGCRDGIYLQSLSLTKEGVKELIISYLDLDNDESIQNIIFKDNDQTYENDIIVLIVDKSINSTKCLKYDLITFDVS